MSSWGHWKTKNSGLQMLHTLQTYLNYILVNVGSAILNRLAELERF